MIETLDDNHNALFGRIHTFKPRRRALSTARAAEFDRAGQRWLIEVHGDKLDPTAVFGRTAPLVIEIGIGAGEALVPMALAEPDIDVIGIDVHTPGIAAAMELLESARQTGDGLNVRLVHGDALEFLTRITPGSVDGIRVFFPDPWPKVRHRHRRLVGEHHLDKLVALLAAGGYLHVATDVADYAAGAQAACDRHPSLSGGPIPRPDWRPQTRFERKGLAAGHSVVDLMYVKDGSVTPSSAG